MTPTVGVVIPTYKRPDMLKATLQKVLECDPQPLEVLVHGMLEPWAIQHRRLKKKLAWHLYQKKDLQDALLLHSTAPTETVSLAHAGLTNEIVTIPNGTDIPDDLDLQDKPTRSGEKRKALFLSRIHPKKGLPMPISLDVEATLSTLGYALPPLFVLVICNRIGGRRLKLVIPWAMGLGAVGSVILGAAQVLTGDNSALYLYDSTNKGLPVGTFANVNHFANFLLITLPFTVFLFRDLGKNWQASDRSMAIME